MHILNLFEAVYKSHVLRLVKKGLECGGKVVEGQGDGGRSMKRIDEDGGRKEGGEIRIDGGCT